MSDTTPVERTFRHQLVAFIPFLDIGWGYNQFLALLQRFYCLISCKGETYSEDVLIGSIEATRLRWADPMAQATLVINHGIEAAYIYENDVLVGIAYPGLNPLKLPLSGRLLLTAKTLNEEVLLTVTTHRRCLCGDEALLVYGKRVEPIGGDLI